jgi:hypothetical protein
MRRRMNSAQKLLEKALWHGLLTKEEISEVAQRVKDVKPGNDEDLVALIKILGVSGATEHRKLVEQFLYYPTDTLVSQMALHTLCNYWCLAREYLNELKTFIRGVEWDDCDDIRLFAISDAGAYLRSSYDKELLQLLISVFEDLGKSDAFYETDTNHRELLQSAAYEAIARAIGKEWEEIQDSDEIEYFLQNKQFDQIDSSVIQQARNMLAKN